MSVLVITKVHVEPAIFEKVVTENAETLRGISGEAQTRGAEHHLFADDGEGNVLIVDVWDRRESFDAFFGSQPQIAQLMHDAGVTDRPSTVSYQVIDGPDRF